MKDSDSQGLEDWVDAARDYAEVSQRFVAMSSQLSTASLDAAEIIDGLHRIRKISDENNGHLAGALRQLAAAVEAESKQQRDSYPGTASAIDELAKLFEAEA